MINKLAIAEQALKSAQEEYDQAHAALKAASGVDVDGMIALASALQIKHFALLSIQSSYNELNQKLDTPHSIQNDQEEWRFVIPRGVESAFEKLFNGVFQVSNRGRVRNDKTGVVRGKPQIDNPRGYPTYNLSVTYAKN
jgi:hypothetical protein